MMKSWIRRAGPQTLHGEDLDLLVRRLWPGQKVRAVEALGGGSKGNFKLTFAGGASFVLRFYLQGRAGLERERAALAIAGERVRVPRVIDAEPDADVLGYPFLVTEFIEGEGPGDAMGERTITSLARTLVAIGEHRFESPGILGPAGGLRRTFESPRAELEDFFRWSLLEGRAGRRLGPDVSQRLFDALAERLVEFDALCGQARLVHGDFKLENILFGPGGNAVIAVLDWEFARAGAPLEDIAALFRTAPFQPRTGPGRDFQDQFIAAYIEAGGELPSRWPRLAEIYDLKTWCGVLGASGSRKSLIEWAKVAVLTVL